MKKFISNSALQSRVKFIVKVISQIKMSKTITIFVAVVAHIIFSSFFKESVDLPLTCIMGIIGLNLCCPSKEEKNPVWWLNLWAIFIVLAEIKVFIFLTIFKSVLFIALSTVVPVSVAEIIINVLAMFCFVYTCIKTYRIENPQGPDCNCPFKLLSQVRVVRVSTLQNKSDWKSGTNYAAFIFH